MPAALVARLLLPAGGKLTDWEWFGVTASTVQIASHVTAQPVNGTLWAHLGCAGAA